jgi:hypothetical protein
MMIKALYENKNYNYNINNENYVNFSSEKIK